jgi:hypothetical protein
MMPPQLARGLKAKRQSPRRHEQRPILEQTHKLDVGDFVRLGIFPDATDDPDARYRVGFPLFFPFVRDMVISLRNLEVTHLPGYPQRIPLKWCKTGFGGFYRPRALFVCLCGRRTTKLYLRSFNFACRKCINGIYASQVCSDKTMRSKLQLIRLQNLLRALPQQAHRTTKAKLIARRNTLARLTQNKFLISSRISHRAEDARPRWR